MISVMPCGYWLAVLCEVYIKYTYIEGGTSGGRLILRHLNIVLEVQLLYRVYSTDYRVYATRCNVGLRQPA